MEDVTMQEVAPMEIETCTYKYNDTVLHPEVPEQTGAMFSRLTEQQQVKINANEVAHNELRDQTID